MVVEAGENRDFPFESIIAFLDDDEFGKAPVFQVLFLLPGQEELASFSHYAVRCDLVFMLRHDSDTVEILCDYDSALFEPITVRRMLFHFRNLFMAATTQPDQEFTKFPILTEDEVRQIAAWNDTTADYPRNLSIPRIFEMVVESSPDAIALSWNGGEWTYAELNRKANQIAHYLITDEGTGLETPIAVFMERSPEMIISMLGILKAGCAYVPLDPDYPQERIAFILNDCKAPIVLTQHRLLERLKTSVKAVSIGPFSEQIWKKDGRNPSIPVHAKNLCYIMYTSGSTGTPKGVCVEHRGVVHVVKATNHGNFSRDDVFLQIVSYCFDVSGVEIWGMLLNGGRIVLFPDQKPTFGELERAIVRWSPTAIYLPSGLFDRFMEYGPSNMGTIRKFFTGGDVLSVGNANRAIEIMNDGILFNDYGPTECSIMCTAYKLTEPHVAGPVPIGRPLSNTTIYILDRFLQQVPVGVPGEIWIGGDGVARGYLNRPELTDARFLRDPFSTDPEARLYRSGDIGRWKSDGNIEFLGRTDNQVKIRGFRIELEEIQHVLRQMEAVQDCVVLAVGKTDKVLVAYVVPKKNGTATPLTLRSFLKSKLPDYMVPSYFVFVEKFALTTNGKVDKKALEALDFRTPESIPVDNSPRSRLEATVGQIWCDVLGLQQVGVHTDFLELGGNSLSAIQILSRISKVFHLDLSVQTIFDVPTVATLSGYIASCLRENPSL
jgi:aspartate racemase